MAEPPTGDEMLQRFRETLSKIVRVPKAEILRMERAQKDKRGAQRKNVAPRRDTG